MTINQRRIKGFTLIELMIVVIIVGFLARMAYPTYTQSVNKTRRLDGKNALMLCATAIEHYFTENQSYLGASTPTVLGLSATSAEGHYILSISSLTETTYTLTATPTGPQSGDSCGALTLDNTFIRTPQACW